MPAVINDEFSKVNIDSEQFGGIVPNYVIGFKSDIISSPLPPSSTSSPYGGQGYSQPVQSVGYQQNYPSNQYGVDSAHGAVPSSNYEQTPIGFRAMPEPQTYQPQNFGVGYSGGYQPCTENTYPTSGYNSGNSYGYASSQPSPYIPNPRYQPSVVPQQASIQQGIQSNYSFSSREESSSFHNKKAHLTCGDFAHQIEGLIDNFTRGSSIHGNGKSGGIKDFIGNIAGSGKGSSSSQGINIGNVIGSIIGGSGRERGKFGGGGGNVKPETLKGGMADIIGNLIGEAAHRFLGVNPATGKILGSIAGNVIFQMGGKDNKLGNIGKIVLDNIVSGKFHRKVDPFVRPEPKKPIPGGIERGGSAQIFYELRDKCLRERVLFEDVEFSASDNSLYFNRRSSRKPVRWMRPGVGCFNIGL